MRWTSPISRRLGNKARQMKRRSADRLMLEQLENRIVPVVNARASFSPTINPGDGFDGVVRLSNPAGGTCSGTLLWTGRHILTDTFDLPSDALAGFLPPNVASPQGEAFVRYRVRSKSSSDTGTRIDAQATIVFDTESPL